MVFNRPPRIQYPPPAEVIELPAAPSVPNKPEGGNWVGIVLPIAAALLSLVLMVVITGNAASGLSYLAFLPVMLVSYLAAFFATGGQKRNYVKKVAEARLKYRADLRAVETRLDGLLEKELKVRNSLDPKPGECLRRAQSQDPRLGERRSGDEDFLFVRLGEGSAPPSFTLNVRDRENRSDEFAKESHFVDQLVEQYTSISPLPIQSRIALVGSIGLAGERSAVLESVRAMLCQLLTHHWPGEVNISAIFPFENKAEWEWLRQVPHASPLLQSAFNLAAAAGAGQGKLLDVLAALEAELQRREQQVDAQKMVRGDSAAGFIPLPRLVVVCDYLDPALRHSALKLLLSRGGELGVYGIFLTDDAQKIPGECGAVLRLNGGRISYEETGLKGLKRECSADRLTQEAARLFAHSMQAIQWPTGTDTSQPPEMITFLDMFGAKKVEDLPLEKWWNEGNPHGYLRAPIGRMSATLDMVFDLNDKDDAHGPHGLLGGMTGSGKSEVLKAIILALAVTHHPYDLNFALIDFKGGAAFNELARLPHTVGVVTDIESNATYAERVIQALTGEIENRKRILETARAAFGFGRSHIDDYRKLEVKIPLPRLVIVFDEFAEFRQRNQAESKKLIGIARQGRSLGVHLILATQNIASAVDPEILQNSSFKICLKVSEPQDSNQLIGIPDAVNLPRGRAYFSSKSRMLYQSAFSGAEYSGDDQAVEGPNTLVRIHPDGRRELIKASARQVKGRAALAPPATQASAVVDYICATARRMQIKNPPVVWPDPLPQKLFLPDLLNQHYTGGWSNGQWNPCRAWGSTASAVIHPVLGLYDHPAKQKQYLVQMDPAQGGGNLLVLGSPGSGKSTLLRSVVASLAYTNSPTAVQMYILDYGGQSALKLLESFPHVGAVVTRLELERTTRLVQFIQGEVLRRNDLLRNAHVDNWVDYNAKVAVEEQLPALYLLVDSFRDFKQSFEADFINEFCNLVGGGQAAGLHLVIASSLQNDFPNDLFASINMRLTFNQADATEYFRIVGQPSETRVQEDAVKGVRPGRGLLRGTPPFEFQAVLPTLGGTDKEQTENLIALAEEMRNCWKGVTPARILSLPAFVSLPRQEKPVSRREYQKGGISLFSMLGQEFENLEPIGFTLNQDGPAYLVGGTTAQTGKTTLLHTWLLGLAEGFSSEVVRFLLLDFHSRSLAAFKNLPHIWEYVGSRNGLEPALTRLSEEIQNRHAEMEQEYEKDADKFETQDILRRWPHILVVIDDYERFALNLGGGAQQLADCLLQGGELGTSYVIAGTLSELPKDYEDPFMQRFRKNGVGALLGGVEGIEDYNNARRPSGQAPAGLPPGRGFIVRRGKAHLFQTAVGAQTQERMNEELEQRIKALRKPEK